MRQKAPPSTVVVLVRHGLTPTTGKEMPYSGAGPSLSEEGRRQAEQTAQRIAEMRGGLPPIAALYSSPLVRTRETAGVLGKLLDLSLSEKPALADCDMGEWAGVSLRELARKPEWSTVLHYPSGFRFPGGESIEGMQFRIVSTVRELAAAHPGHTVLVVSHADPIKAALAEALGVHLDLFQRIVIAPASASAVNYGPSGPQVLFMNWAPSLPDSAAGRPRAGRRRHGA